MSAEQGSTSNTPGGATETPKVTVVGRIGQEATFRTVPEKDDLLVGNLSIAEHPDKDTTVWHDVALFGDRAKRLQEQFDAGELRVGQEVEVVGTLRRRERPTKDGGIKIVEQIYAYSLKPVDRGRYAEQPPHSQQSQDITGPSDLQTPPGSWQTKQ